MFLAAATLFSCSYDSSEIENGITDLENRVAALEQKADYLESQLKAVSEFVSGNFISRVGTDEKGNFVITYQDRNGEKKTVTLAKASSVASLSKMRLDRSLWAMKSLNASAVVA